MFKLVRFFSLTSFVSMVIAAILLGIFYRHYAIATLAEHGNRENVTVARVLSNTMWEQVMTLLNGSHASLEEGERLRDLILTVRSEIAEKAHGLDIAKIKLYSLSGRTVFSTELSQIGEKKDNNPGIIKALKGVTTSDFVHKDSFNALDQVIENRDLLQTYLPLYDKSHLSVIGVVEVYSDHTRILEQVNRTQWTMMAGTSFVLLLLYSVLYFIIRHANAILIRQDSELRSSLDELNKAKESLESNVADRTSTLTISNQLLEQEIKERGRIEKVLRERERRIRAIMDNIFNAIITIDDNGYLKSFNPTAERLFGYSESEAIGQSVSILTPKGQVIAPEHLKIEDNLSSNSYPAAQITELTARRKNGSTFPIELAVTRIEESENHCYIGTIRDISERKRAETELEETRQKYFHQEKMAAIGTLAAGIVHEIGNPIAAISGLIHDMCDDPDNSTLDEENRDNLTMVLDHVGRLINITRDVSEFSNPHEDEVHLLDLNNLIGKTCRLMRHDKRLTSVEIRLDLDQQLPAVFGIGDHLVQVFMNLIINAADAVGEVDSRAGIIEVNSRLDGNMIQVTVRDNGCGMTEESLERATEAFYTTKSMGKGTGLGLSLCHSIISAHNGTLKIDSKLGEGSVINVYIPHDLDEAETTPMALIS